MSNLRATLIRIDVPSPDWYDLKKQSTFVYKTEMGEERVSADNVPVDCRTIGQEVELVYTFITIGNAEGYIYIPHSLTPVSHEGEIAW